MLRCAVLSQSVASDSLLPHGYSLPGSSVHGDSPGKNTGVGGHALLQGIFPAQGLNPHCRQILYQLSYQGSPRKLEWIAYHFSRGSSWHGTQTRTSCIAGRFFINWATKEALGISEIMECTYTIQKCQNICILAHFSKLLTWLLGFWDLIIRSDTYKTDKSKFGQPYLE